MMDFLSGLVGDWLGFKVFGERLYVALIVIAWTVVVAIYVLPAPVLHLVVRVALGLAAFAVVGFVLIAVGIASLARRD